MNMKNTLFIALVALSTSVFAQEAPSFLKEFNYTLETCLSSEGIEFEYFEVRDEQYKELKNVINKLNRRRFVRVDKSGMLITKRYVDQWTVMTFSGFGFKRISVFQE
jgi:hypothetical protein